MPKIGMQPIRREQLIRATIEIIGQKGLVGVTMAKVARQAGLSTGIVSHYFGNKHGLLYAAMRSLLSDLKDAVAARRKVVGGNSQPQTQLRAIIDGNFDQTQINPAAMRVWLAFWSASLQQNDLAELQRINERRLHSNLLWQFRRALPEDEAKMAADGLAAMIDGLWLRGSLSMNRFDVERARQVAYQYVDEQLAGVHK